MVDGDKVREYLRKVQNAKQKADAAIKTSFWDTLTADSDPRETRMLVFYGASGSGKTHSSKQALKEIGLTNGTKIEIVSDYCNSLMTYDFETPYKPRNPYFHDVGRLEALDFLTKGYPPDGVLDLSYMVNRLGDAALGVVALMADKDRPGSYIYQMTHQPVFFNYMTMGDLMAHGRDAAVGPQLNATDMTTN